MYFFYNILVIIISWFLIPISWFNKKIKLFLNGRKNTFQQLSEIKTADRVIWFHCASLGEFEQGRPLIEQIKIQYPTAKIVLSFFSPSGYEIQKNYEFASVVCYLPLDTNKNARKFLDLIHPEIAIFIKYEFWPNILKELKIRNINTLLVSAIFRENQVFFKQNTFTKQFMQNSLKTFTHFFVQDTNSKKLLNGIKFENVTVAGDTRFDRVYNNSLENHKLDFVESFLKLTTDSVLVAGSTWKKDEELLVNYINEKASNNQQFIIAPHNINSEDIKNLKNNILKKTILFSEISNVIDIDAQVLIVDTIGLLNKIYRYGTIAFVGGGFGTGIHNILEPTTFGVPILIGPKYHKFIEAIDLIKLKGCFVVNNQLEFDKTLANFNDKKELEKVKMINNKYVNKNIGATLCIINYIKNTIN